jgi:hypothetical protein
LYIFKGEKCDINLKKDLPRNQPLMLNSKNEFVMPDKKGVLHLQPGENLRLVCPGKDNTVSKLGVVEAPVSCAGGGQFYVSQNKALTLKELECSSIVQHAAQVNKREKCEISGNYQVRNSLFCANDANFIENFVLKLHCK